MESIGPKPLASRNQPLAPVARVDATTALEARGYEVIQTSPLAGAARSAAAQPPVDEKRVADIRKAIKNGTYPLIPERIADRLIALKNEWRPK